MKRVLIYMDELRSCRTYIVIAFQSWKLVVCLYLHTSYLHQQLRASGKMGCVAQLAWSCFCKGCAESVLSTASLSMKSNMDICRACWRCSHSLAWLHSFHSCLHGFFTWSYHVYMLHLTLCDHSPLPRTDDELQDSWLFDWTAPWLCLLTRNDFPAPHFFDSNGSSRYCSEMLCSPPMGSRGVELFSW